MELSDYLRVLRAHWVGVVACVLVALAAAALHRDPAKVYAANANGFVSAGAPDPALASVNDALAKSRATSYVDIATSRAVADQVIEDLGLEASGVEPDRPASRWQPPDTVLLKITAESSTPRGRPAARRRLGERARRPGRRDREPARHAPTPALRTSSRSSPPRCPRHPSCRAPRSTCCSGWSWVGLLGLAYAVRAQPARPAAALQRRGREAVRRRRSSARPRRPGAGPRARATGAARRASPSTPARAPSAPRRSASCAPTSPSWTSTTRRASIVVTSPQQADGKSTVAANLAAAIASSGQPVTLVDGDLRRPDRRANPSAWSRAPASPTC